MWVDCTVSGVEEIESDDLLSFYPNPVSDFINLEVSDFNPGSVYQFSIFDLTGKRIFAQQLANQHELINFDRRMILPGLYIIQLVGDEGVINQKISFN